MLVRLGNDGEQRASRSPILLFPYLLCVLFALILRWVLDGGGWEGKCTTTKQHLLAGGFSSAALICTLFHLYRPPGAIKMRVMSIMLSGLCLIFAADAMLLYPQRRLGVIVRFPQNCFRARSHAAHNILLLSMACSDRKRRYVCVHDFGCIPSLVTYLRIGRISTPAAAAEQQQEDRQVRFEALSVFNKESTEGFSLAATVSSEPHLPLPSTKRHFSEQRKRVPQVAVPDLLRVQHVLPHSLVCSLV